MNVNIIHVGILKEKYYADAVAEYEKRLLRYCKIRNIEIKEARLPQSPSGAEIAAALDSEGRRIIELLPEKSYKIALCVEGKELSSPELALLSAVEHSVPRWL